MSSYFKLIKKKKCHPILKRFILNSFKTNGCATITQLHFASLVGNKTLILKRVGCRNIEQAQNNNLCGKSFLLKEKNYGINSE